MAKKSETRMTAARANELRALGEVLRGVADLRGVDTRTDLSTHDVEYLRGEGSDLDGLELWDLTDWSAYWRVPVEVFHGDEHVASLRNGRTLEPTK